MKKSKEVTSIKLRFFSITTLNISKNILILLLFSLSLVSSVNIVSAQTILNDTDGKQFVITLDTNNDSLNFYNSAPLIGSLIVAGVLGITLFVNSKNINKQTKMQKKNIKNQTKMDLAKFYIDFDGKLRESTLKLRELYYDDIHEVYHYMAKIIVTLRIIMRVKEELNEDMDKLVSEEWFKYALHLIPHFNEEKRCRKIDKGDAEAAEYIKKFCNVQTKEGEKIIPECVYNEEYTRDKNVEKS